MSLANPKNFRGGDGLHAVPTKSTSGQPVAFGKGG